MALFESSPRGVLSAIECPRRSIIPMAGVLNHVRNPQRRSLSELSGAGCEGGVRRVSLCSLLLCGEILQYDTSSLGHETTHEYGDDDENNIHRRSRVT
jgi:hypothetical protein